MLKITVMTVSTKVICLGLEGRLVGPWVPVLSNAVSEADSSPSGIRLDLSGVHFVDNQGLALLQALRTQGAVLQGVTPFIEELLRERQS